MEPDTSEAETIKRLRTERGWTIARFAQEAGRDASYIGRIESGKRRPSASYLYYLVSILTNHNRSSPSPGDE